MTPQTACPICGKPAAPSVHPFCSSRCAGVDLGRWITGQYVIPGPVLPGNEPDPRLDRPSPLD